MDPFTRKLLERTQARRDALNSKLAKTPQPLPRKRRSPLKDESNNGLTIHSAAKELDIDDDSPGKRQCMDVSCEDSDVSKENDSSDSVPLEVLTNVKPALHGNVTNESFHNNKDTKCIGTNLAIKVTTPKSESTNPKGRAVRLAALAANINNWEDDLPDATATRLLQQPIPKARPLIESCSTPPKSTSGSSLSSSASVKTPSSDQQSSSSTAARPLFPLKNTSPVITPKLKLPVEENGTWRCETSKELCISQAPIVCLPSSIKQVTQQQHQLQQKPAKKVIWDKAIVATLEAQGFVQSPSKSKLEYDFPKKTQSRQLSEEGKESSEDEDVECSGNDIKRIANSAPMVASRSCQIADVEKQSVKDLAKKFDNPLMAPTRIPQKDPTELPLSARVALFEKNIGSALPLPKNPIIPMTKPTVKPIFNSTVEMPKTGDEQDKDFQRISPTKVGTHTFELHKRLFEHANKDWKSNEIAAKISEDRQKDMAVVMNRWSYNKKVLETQTSNKREKAEYTPLGKSVVDNEENDFEDNSSNDSADSDDSSVDEQAQITKPPPLPMTSPLKYQTHELQENELYEESEIADDDVSDEKDDNYDSETDVPVRAHSTNNNDDVNYKDYSGSENSDSDMDSEENQDLDSSILQAAFNRMQSSKIETKLPEMLPPVQTTPVEPVSEFRICRPQHDENVSPLLHTVSFYRRQKEINKTPVRIVSRDDVIHSPPSDSEDYKRFHLFSEEECRAKVQEKIKEFHEDANAQLIIMSQASQALNLCRSTAEFHGSAEQIEGERLLLISSQRRQACLNEIQRLKTEGGLGSMPALLVARKGSLTIGEMRLTLKREFLSQTDNGKSGEFVHYFVCLVKHRGQVVATQMISTMDGISSGAFHLPNLINLRDLDHDFNVLFEVYGLQTKRENINKDRKTLANRKEKSKLTLTPKKKLNKQDSRLTSPGVQSPGGPSAICSTSFSLIGFTMVTIKTIQRKTWSLEKVPFVSPLDGNLSMKVQCHNDHHIDEQGFLTMFEDVSGFGAWHRRWFHLSHRYISYWKYPDDVKRKEPIGQIDLCQCVTSTVSLVPRDICARPHTLMLLTVRPPSKDEVDTLVSQNYNTYTATKVLLSADTKDERIVWCQRFNEALENLRMWTPNALRPIPSNST